MSGQVAEQVAPQIAGHANEGKTPDPARDAPKQVVRSDQRDEQKEREPYAARTRGARQRINKIFHAVLRRDGTTDCAENRRQDHRMGGCVAADISKDECKRSIGEPGQFVHARSPFRIRGAVPMPDRRERETREKAYRGAKFRTESKIVSLSNSQEVPHCSGTGRMWRAEGETA